MKLTLLAAIADSIATARCVRVATPVPDIEAAVRFIERNFHDVDYDPHPDRITIFGDDPSIPVSPDGDGDEGHFVLDLAFPSARPTPSTSKPVNPSTIQPPPVPTATSRNCADSNGSYNHWVWERISGTHFVGWEYSAPPEEVRPGQTCPAGRWSVTRPTGKFKIEKE